MATCTNTADGDADGHGHGCGDGRTVTVYGDVAVHADAAESAWMESCLVERTRKNDLHKLDVYRCALELYRLIGVMVARFPTGEADLRSQMKRASRSVPHNIGEGVGKRGKARAAAYEIALGEAKELIVALDCVEIDQLAPTADIVAAQDLADRVSAMLTKLIRSV